jgi:hypothetical protein
MSFNGKYLLIYRDDNILDIIELGYDKIIDINASK